MEKLIKGEIKGVRKRTGEKGEEKEEKTRRKKMTLLFYFTVEETEA